MIRLDVDKNSLHIESNEIWMHYAQLEYRTDLLYQQPCYCVNVLIEVSSDYTVFFVGDVVYGFYQL